LAAVPAGLAATVTLVKGAETFTAALPPAFVASTAVPGAVTTVLDTLPAGAATVVEVTVVRGAATFTVAPPAPDFAATLVPGAPTPTVVAPSGWTFTPTPTDCAEDAAARAAAMQSQRSLAILFDSCNR
jgi:hypothetical protein